MKIVIAPDAFKESLSAPAVAEAIRDGLAEVWPEANYVLKPMADGGEGTVEAVIASTAAERQRTRVEGPLGEPVDAVWAWERASATATIEVAEASGLMRVSATNRDILRASTFGTGQLLAAALDRGVRTLVIGLGGSATNDGGAGLAAALGARFLDADGEVIDAGPRGLASLASIDLSGLNPRLAGVDIVIASDVNNPLCGERGASAVFGPQKGALPGQIPALDAALRRLADVHASQVGKDWRDTPGAGAAGGAGWALMAMLGGVMRPGVEMIAQLNGLDHAIQGADWVITGEGRMDAQTAGGKVPFGVARMAKTRGVPALAIVGSLGEGYDALYAHGLVAAFSLTPGPMSLEEAMAQAAPLIRTRARDLARVIAARTP